MMLLLLLLDRSTTRFTTTGTVDGIIRKKTKAITVSISNKNNNTTTKRLGILVETHFLLLLLFMSFCSTCSSTVVQKINNYYSTTTTGTISRSCGCGGGKTSSRGGVVVALPFVSNYYYYYYTKNKSNRFLCNTIRSTRSRCSSGSNSSSSSCTSGTGSSNSNSSSSRTVIRNQQLRLGFLWTQQQPVLLLLSQQNKVFARENNNNHKKNDCWRLFSSLNDSTGNTISTSTMSTSASTSVSPSTSKEDSNTIIIPENVRTALLNCPTITLRNGMKHPIIGYGTYKVGYIPPSATSSSTGSATNSSTTTGSNAGETPAVAQEVPVVCTAEECVLDALNVGYRFIECAQFYGNEQQVGNAIVKSGIPRSELFLCSKVWTTTIEQGPHAIRQQLECTLQNLKTTYLDLYLIHWPVPVHHITAYKTLIELRNSGKIKGIGVSNYAIEDYNELKYDKTIDSNDLPLVNQIEINPFLYRNTNTIPFFEKEKVVLQSYRTLRDGKVMDHPVLLEMASTKKYNCSVAQLLGKWCVQHGYVYIPKSTKVIRMIENANVFDPNFIISNEDMYILDNTLTTPEALQTFQELYRKCVNRDTTKDGTYENVKMNITID